MCIDVVERFGRNPDADVVEICCAITRAITSIRASADSYAQGLVSLERDWRAPLIRHTTAIETTWAQFRAMELAARPQDLLNWRFQQGLYRAYYDAYTRQRLLYETGLEREAMDKLARRMKHGATVALAQAEAALDESVTKRVALDRRARRLRTGRSISSRAYGCS
jgi:hypothetical protein